MKERPILFSAPMVRAILAGRKTMTRRVVKPQPNESVATEYDSGGNVTARRSYGWSWRKDHNMASVECPSPIMASLSPYGVPGDRLWCREAWAHGDGDGETFAEIIYRADGVRVRHAVSEEIASKHLATIRRLEVCGNGDNWKPSIHMPRWASRLTLEIKSVRVERLQEISEDDAIAEGCGRPENGTLAVLEYSRLWDEINGAGSWAANCWVWVVGFEVVK